MTDGVCETRRRRVEPGIYSRVGADGRPAYEIGWRDSRGRQRWRRVEGGIKAARAALALAHAQRARGERVADDPRLRLEDAAQAWWDARVVKLRPATQSAYAAGLGHLRRSFSTARMADIGPADVAAFVAAQQKAGFKGWTIRGQVTVLSSIFTYSARHLGFVGANPVSLLDRVERPRSDDERPKRILTADELQRLLHAVDASYRIVFELAAETGCRLGEALGIVWGDVDLEAETVTFTHQLDRSGQRVALKTKRSQRCVEVTAALASDLRTHKLATPRSGRHDFVFLTRNGTPHDHRNIAGRVLARAAERAGLQAIERDGRIVEHAPTFHSLRHSHGSALIAAGWDIEEVSARLGHSDIGTTQRVYVHAYDAARRSSARRDRLAVLYREAHEGPGGRVVAELPGRH
jgi:integrase